MLICEKKTYLITGAPVKVGENRTLHICQTRKHCVYIG
jgi:hypothetical protein